MAKEKKKRKHITKVTLTEEHFKKYHQLKEQGLKVGDNVNSETLSSLDETDPPGGVEVPHKPPPPEQP